MSIFINLISHLVAVPSGELQHHVTSKVSKVLQYMGELDYVEISLQKHTSIKATDIRSIHIK